MGEFNDRRSRKSAGNPGTGGEDPKSIGASILGTLGIPAARIGTSGIAGASTPTVGVDVIGAASGPGLMACRGRAAKSSFASRVIIATSGNAAIPAVLPAVSVLPVSVLTTVSDPGSLVLMVLVDVHILQNAERILR